MTLFSIFNEFILKILFRLFSRNLKRLISHYNDFNLEMVLLILLMLSPNPLPYHHAVSKYAFFSFLFFHQILKNFFFQVTCYTKEVMQVGIDFAQGLTFFSFRSTVPLSFVLTIWDQTFD